MERQKRTKVQKNAGRQSQTHTPAVRRSSSARHPLLELQRSIGNLAVRRLINTPYLQAKLQVSTPDDPSELEADRVADTVMRVPLAVRDDDDEEKVKTKLESSIDSEPQEASDLIHRACSDCEEEKDSAAGPPILRRKGESEQKPEDEAKPLQAKAAPAQTTQLNDSVASKIHSMNGGGSPLPATTRSFFEPRFGVDFSHVRVHADSRAAETAKSINARAFTVGRDIAFGPGQYSPHSDHGRRLLAHELTHVVQQGGEQTQSQVGRDVIVQRDDPPPDHLTTLNEMLDRNNVPEEDVLALLPQLTEPEKNTVITTVSYKSRMASAFNTGQMVRAVRILALPLDKQLEWIEAATSPSNIDYSEIRSLITSAAQAARDTLKTTRWRDFFVGVCDNSTIITAVTDLHFDLQTELEWIEEEASPSNLDYADIQPLIRRAPQPERDVLKTNRWRDFFVGVCTNATIITAVTDLHFDLKTQLEWIEEEASPRNLDYADLQPLILAAPQPERDVLKTTAWRDFFVGVCTNATIITAVTDLHFDLKTQLQWIEEEASPSNLDYADLHSLIAPAPQADKDALKTIGWRDFFVGVCTNKTIKDALDDLNFDMQTTVEWLLEEASPSNVDYTWLCNKFKTLNAFPPGEADIACAIMERDIRDKTFNSSPDHTPPGWITRAHQQLLVANEMGGMVGQTAKWKPSNQASGTTFQQWASTTPQGPTPNLNALTVINCWEMIMLAAFRAGALSWTKIHTIYSAGVPDWFSFLVNELSFNSRIPYDPSGPAQRPVAGDIVFFDGAAHVALGAGSTDAMGRTKIYSFWPPPNTAFTAGGTIDQVKITTIEELNDYWVAAGYPAFKIEFTTPNW